MSRTEKTRTAWCAAKSRSSKLFGTSDLASQKIVTEQKELADAPARGCAVSCLTLTNFRNYKSLRLKTHAGILVFTGANGAGKTNLLEAVSLLAPGRGLRRSRLSGLARQEGESNSRAWAVAARVDTPDGHYDVGTGIKSPTGYEKNETERRTVRINGETARNQAVLRDILSVHWLTPQMDRLFQEGMSTKRRFLDRMVFGWDPAHAGRISAYEKAMQQRMKLLREESPLDRVWLSALEETMVTKGVAIAVGRLDMATRLAMAAKDGWGPFPGADVAITGELETWLEKGPALAAEDRFRAGLIATRGEAARSGRTCLGPQQSNLTVRHMQKNQDAALCSTGEQKALLIALILANARIGATEEGALPVLLLDEVAAHLDEKRRRVLFDTLIDLGSQVWLTGTDENLFKHLRGRANFFTVTDGKIKCLS